MAGKKEISKADLSFVFEPAVVRENRFTPSAEAIESFKMKDTNRRLAKGSKAYKRLMEKVIPENDSFHKCELS